MRKERLEAVTVKTDRKTASGFTLIEIVIAVAMVAVLAGAMVPLVFREIQATREDATLEELKAIRTGLLECYEDTGRFPTEAEGLAALVADPGINGWQGPYVGGAQGDPAVEVNDDSWGAQYSYDLDPTTDPVGAADVVIVSPGIDGALSFGAINGTWTIDGVGDDLLVIVSIGPMNRDKTMVTEYEMEAIGEAASRYFADQAAFPTTTGQLSGTYLHPGLDNTAFIDPWNTAYQLTVDSSGPGAPEFIVTSFGPDRADNSGAGDDLVLTVSSVPSGRASTMYKLEIAQNALNQDGTLILLGNWPSNDRPALGLATNFDNDGWGRPFEVNIASRSIFSPGPDGDPATTTDNVPAGFGPN